MFFLYVGKASENNSFYVKYVPNFLSGELHYKYIYLFIRIYSIYFKTISLEHPLFSVSIKRYLNLG